MRRIFFLSLGVVEFLIATVLLVIAWQLPSPRQVGDAVGRVERVSRQTSDQVGRLRRQLTGLRQQRPEMVRQSRALKEQLDQVIRTLEREKIDVTSMRNLNDSLENVARGLDGLSDVFNPELIRQLGVALETTATYLDEKVVPAAADAADHLERSTAALKADAERLAGLLKGGPLDLKAAQDVHEALGRFADGLDRVAPPERLKNLMALRDGFKGMETALNTGAGQVERLSSYTYPVIKLEGLKPKVDQKPFWPEGGKIAEGMRDAAKGAGAAVKEMGSLHDDLPKLQKSLEESRKVALATRDAIGEALKRQDKLAPLLKDVPAHAARLAEELPKLGEGLAKVMRDTSRLKDVATAMRKAEKALETSAKRWPDVRKTLVGSSELLRQAQARLKPVLERPERYESVLQDTVIMAKTFSAALPLITDQINDDLREQEKSLDHLGRSIDSVTEVLPDISATAGGLLQTMRLFLALMALVFALHGTYLVISSRQATPAANGERPIIVIAQPPAIDTGIHA
jgi:uncharacterized coiled-coil DUF342 family protein